MPLKFRIYKSCAMKNKSQQVPYETKVGWNVKKSESNKRSRELNNYAQESVKIWILITKRTVHPICQASCRLFYQSNH